MKNPTLRISMREIIKWLHRQAVFGTQEFPLVGQSLLASKLMPGSQNHEELMKVLKLSHSTRLTSSANQHGNQVTFTEGSLSVTLDDVMLSRSPLWSKGHSPPAKFVQHLVRLAFAVKNEEPVLLIGPTCYKTLLIDTWVKITGASENFIKVHLTPDTEAPELVGQMQPFSFLDAVRLLPEVSPLSMLFSPSSFSCCFFNAMKH